MFPVSWSPKALLRKTFAEAGHVLDRVECQGRTESIHMLHKISRCSFVSKGSVPSLASSANLEYHYIVTERPLNGQVINA